MVENKFEPRVIACHSLKIRFASTEPTHKYRVGCVELFISDSMSGTQPDANTFTNGLSHRVLIRWKYAQSLVAGAS
jgi:hypothetical protein